MWKFWSSWAFPIKTSFPRRETSTRSSATRRCLAAQAEYTLRLADPARPGEEKPDAVHVGQRSVHGGRGSEHVLQIGLEDTVEIRRCETGPEDGDSRLLGSRQEGGWHILPGGHEDGRAPRERRRLRGANGPGPSEEWTGSSFRSLRTPGSDLPRCGQYDPRATTPDSRVRRSSPGRPAIRQV